MENPSKGGWLRSLYSRYMLVDKYATEIES